uniref:Uncharacterized protein n=1 Tax=Anguilla anguilla TaxID=7936 RepID=A0A0E9U214_ANGAN
MQFEAEQCFTIFINGKRDSFCLTCTSLTKNGTCIVIRQYLCYFWINNLFG